MRFTFEMIEGLKIVEEEGEQGTPQTQHSSGGSTCRGCRLDDLLRMHLPRTRVNMS